MNTSPAALAPVSMAGSASAVMGVSSWNRAMSPLRSAEGTARATSAAFKPRISTVTKSWAVVFMSRRMEGREALVKLAAGRLSLHSPTHSVLARIEVFKVDDFDRKFGT